MRALLVDDEPILAEVITTLLQAARIEVRWVPDLASARRALNSARFDLVLLDLNLPDGDGRSLFAEPTPLPPVIVLSALGEEADVVELLELGARDYVCKPFRAQELLARLRSAVRDAEPSEDGALTVRFDAEERCMHIGRQRIQISRLEARLVTRLRESPDRPVIYDQLIEAVWQGSPKDNVALRVLVAQLRQKIEPDVERPTILLSDRGVGYRWNTRPGSPPHAEAC